MSSHPRAPRGTPLTDSERVARVLRWHGGTIREAELLAALQPQRPGPLAAIAVNMALIIGTAEAVDLLDGEREIRLREAA